MKRIRYRIKVLQDTEGKKWYSPQEKRGFFSPWSSYGWRHPDEEGALGAIEHWKKIENSKGKEVVTYKEIS